MLDTDNPISIAAGITIGLIASFVQSLGLTIQRKSHVLNQQLPESQQVVEHRRPSVLLDLFPGSLSPLTATYTVQTLVVRFQYVNAAHLLQYTLIVLFAAIFVTSNVLGSVFQIASLPVVILAPLGAVSLLWNALFARILLGDMFSPWMVIGTLFIAGGALLIAFFGIVPEPTHTLDDLLRLLGRTSFVVYFTLLVAAIFVCLVITHLLEFSLRHKVQQEHNSPECLTPINGTLSTSTPSNLADERTPLIDRKATNLSRPSSPSLYTSPKHARMRLLLAVSYASASGILSGMCLLFAKSGVELLLLTIGGRNQFWRWEAWLLVLGLVVFALLQLWYMHKSLLFADPTIVCPLAFCFYNVSSIVSGLIYFDQVDMLSTLHLCLMMLGMAVLLGGVWVVSFNAGSGRVDVGTWQEGDDDLDSEEEDDQVRETAPGGYFQPAPLRLEATVSEPADSVQSTAGNTILPTMLEREQTTSDTATSSPESPSGQRRRIPKRHRHSFLQLVDSQSSSSQLALPAGGFSIGLSPVSPGFAIVPKRRTSGFRDIIRRTAMRRTVSDGDYSPDLYESNGTVEDLGDANPNGHISADDLDSQRLDRARGGPWGWLRRIILG